MRKRYFLLVSIGALIWNHNSYVSSAALSYDSETEYTKHKEVTKEYFSGKSRNQIVKTTLATLNAELANAKTPLSKISLDKMTSRRRIMLIKQITNIITGYVGDNDYFEDYTYKSIVMRKSKFPVKFTLAYYDRSTKAMSEVEIILTHLYSKTQPGNAVITFNGEQPITYSDLRRDLRAGLEKPKKVTSAEFQKIVATTLLHNRKDGSQAAKMVAEVNFLLDFEVARRLTRIDRSSQLADLEKEAEQLILFLDWCGDMGKEGEPSASATEISNAESKLQMLESQITQLKVESGATTKYMKFNSENYDEIPVASSIVALLKLGKDDTVPLENFFTESGEYDGFVVRDPDIRRKGVRRSIRALSGGDHNARSLTKDQIKLAYKETFGEISDTE